jgi:hypothetical protein
MLAIAFHKRYCARWVISTMLFFPSLHLTILIATHIFQEAQALSTRFPVLVRFGISHHFLDTGDEHPQPSSVLNVFTLW